MELLSPLATVYRWLESWRKRGEPFPCLWLSDHSIVNVITRVSASRWFTSCVSDAIGKTQEQANAKSLFRKEINILSEMSHILCSISFNGKKRIKNSFKKRIRPVLKRGYLIVCESSRVRFGARKRSAELTDIDIWHVDTDILLPDFCVQVRLFLFEWSIWLLFLDRCIFWSFIFPVCAFINGTWLPRSNQ